MKRISIAALTLLLGTSSAFAEELYVVEHAITDATARVGRAKDNLGDILTFSNPVFDTTNKRQVGTSNGFCIRTVLGKAYYCQWVTSVRDGQITVQGPFYDASDSVLAVTGGTGKFAGARGQMRLHARDAKGSEYDFKFTLTR
jgi:hypothetical protein